MYSSCLLRAQVTADANALADICQGNPEDANALSDICQGNPEVFLGECCKCDHFSSAIKLIWKGPWDEEDMKRVFFALISSE